MLDNDEITVRDKTVLKGYYDIRNTVYGGGQLTLAFEHALDGNYEASAMCFEYIAEQMRSVEQE